MAEPKIAGDRASRGSGDQQRVTSSKPGLNPVMMCLPAGFQEREKGQLQGHYSSDQQHRGKRLDHALSVDLVRQNARHFR